MGILIAMARGALLGAASGAGMVVGFHIATAVYNKWQERDNGKSN